MVTAVCRVWLERTFLREVGDDRRAVWLSPTAGVLPDGRLWLLPAPCRCGDDRCPTEPATTIVMEVAA